MDFLIFFYLFGFILSSIFIFKKLGIEPLKALIPIYNFYVYAGILYPDKDYLAEENGLNKNRLMAFVLLIVPIISIFTLMYLQYKLSLRFTDDERIQAISGILPPVGGLIIAFGDYEYNYRKDLTGVFERILNERKK